MSDIENLKYPIGRFKYEPSGQEELEKQIERIASLPGKLRSVAEGLTEERLDTPYREGGWSLRQVIHHIPDSHMNAYIRFKLAVTEDNPIIKPYYEDRWAECDDARHGPVSVSLNLLESIHNRWVLFLNSLPEAAFNRTYHHPEQGKDYSLREVVSMYAWHGEHHLAHITEAEARNRDK